MKVVFVYPAFESLGIEYLSAVLKEAGHRTSLVLDPMLFDDTFIKIPALAKRFSFKDEVVNGVLKENPDLVALSVMTDLLPWCGDIARRLKDRAPDLMIVAGGIHVTMNPQGIMNLPVDFAIAGEGERAFTRFVDSVASGAADTSIKGLVYRKNGSVVFNGYPETEKELDSLPPPDKGLYYGTSIDFSETFTALASRGCPFSCTYCYSSRMHGIYRTNEIVRRHGVDRVIGELRRAKEIYSPKYVWFHDDVFGQSVAWLRGFAERYSMEIGIPFDVNINPSVVTDERIGLIKEAGCIHINMGVQTFDPAIRKNVLNRHESDSRVEEAVRIIQRHSIEVSIDNIVGLPGETKETYEKMIRFFNRHRTVPYDVYWLRYYPGTPIVDAA
ncbi:MAG: B12-binding domain-containing radical SAM protein, partial [Deltaproteobacteria bacterium]|nr:B12-binding domain-containing radical SAM protein [Deltaproteobacteria bacterium]